MPDGLDLDALKALTDAATPGPWQAWGDGLVWAARPGDPVSGSTEMADAHFIAAARTAVPALIAEVERLRRDLEEVAGRLVGYKRLYDQALTEIANATNQGTAWMDEARRQAAERDREFQRASQAEAERDRRGDELRRAQAVIDAAKAWRDARPGPWVSGADVEFHLFAAVDALEATMPP